MMTLDEIYENIGQSLFNVISHENWDEAKLNIEFEGDGVVGYNGHYTANTIKENISVRHIPREIRHWIRELHSITTEKGHNKWNRAVFTLLRTGKFDMEFIWDQVLQDEIERLSNK
jgi:hypothetical protein